MDTLVLGFDRALRAISGLAEAARPIPAASPPVVLNDVDRQQSGALMRVNHSGEVCAQALYQAQAVFSRHEETRRALADSAAEELDHLRWTADRVKELHSERSALDPLWYLGAFCIGAAVSALGDEKSLAFLKETERQVVQHLNRHLELLPVADERSREILQQMRADEARHADTATHLGAGDMPPVVAMAMRWSSKVMTTLAYRL